MARRRKCIISAPPTLRNTKYKCKSRCEKKQWVFSVPFILCCPSGFLPLRSPYHLQRWSFSRGARCLMYHSQREGGRLLQLVSKESNLKLSEHLKMLSTLISRSRGDEWRNQSRAFVTCQWHTCLRTSILIWNQTAFLIMLTVTMCGCIFSNSQPDTKCIYTEAQLLSCCIYDWEVVAGRC